MTARSRQIVIGISVVIIIGVVLYGIFLYVSRPADPTCFDDIKNQAEEGPDCGGPCTITCQEKYPAPIVFETQKIINIRENTFDVVFSVENKNSFMGALDIEYQMNFLDSQGNLIAQRRKNTYAWPGEKRLLVESSLVAPTLAMVDIRVVTTQWKKFEHNLKLPIFPVSVEYAGPLGPGQIGFFEVNGIIKNETLRKYDTLDVSLVLLNDAGEIVGANTTKLNNFSSLEERFFRIIWFNQLSGVARKTQFYISTNPALLGL